MKTPKTLSITDLMEKMPDMSMIQLRKAFSQDCGCSSSCQARTHQVNHGFCYFHEKVYDEILRRQSRPPSMGVAKIKPEEGACQSCGVREGQLVRIDVGPVSVRLCRPCLAELETLLPAGRPFPKKKKRS